MDDALTAADGVLYYQTSMGPQFALAHIPAIQVGHEKYEDILVRNHLCPSVVSAEGLREALANSRSEPPSEKLLDDLGIVSNWPDRLISLMP